jgi:hypothetical protein
MIYTQIFGTVQTQDRQAAQLTSELRNTISTFILTIWINHPGHSLNFGEHIQLQDTITLSTIFRYMDHIIRKVTEIELYLSNVNREGGFCLSKSWKPLYFFLKEYERPPL